jgi:hypothetical protein
MELLRDYFRKFVWDDRYGLPKYLSSISIRKYNISVV